MSKYSDFFNDLRFSKKEISAILSHPGWTEEKLYKELKYFLDNNLSNKEELHNDFAITYEDSLLIPYSVANDPSFLQCFKTLDSFEEEEAEWLIPGWLPKGQIGTLGSDGGVGKTTMWCDSLANISAGKRCFLDPVDFVRDPQKVLFLTTEDSIRKKLKKKLRLAGADMSNIITPDFSGDNTILFEKLKFGTPEMSEMILHFKPALCVFDPLQGFVPPDINMGSRNAMRNCLAPLIGLGEETGTTFLIVCHTNKRKGAYGRDRLADSADLWDISRSVIMLGYTNKQGVRYVSHEKSNYGELQQSLLFSIDADGNIVPEGSTWKRDKEFIQELEYSTSKNSRADCKQMILDRLNSKGGSMLIKDLDSDMEDEGFNSRTVRRAKEELKNDSIIKYDCKGFGEKKTWIISLNDVEE